MLIRVIYKMDLIAMIYLANIFLAHHKGRKLEQFPGQFWGQEIFRGVSLDGDFYFSYQHRYVYFCPCIMYAFRN